MISDASVSSRSLSQGTIASFEFLSSSKVTTGQDSFPKGREIAERFSACIDTETALFQKYSESLYRAAFLSPPILGRASKNTIAPRDLHLPSPVPHSHPKLTVEEQPPLKKKKLNKRKFSEEVFSIKGFFQKYSTLFENYDNQEWMLAFSGKSFEDEIIILSFEDKIIISYIDLCNLLKNKITEVKIDFSKIKILDFLDIVVINPFVFLPQMYKNPLLLGNAIWDSERIQEMVRSIFPTIVCLLDIDIDIDSELSSILATAVQQPVA